jgi:hypothetical protein
MPPSIKKVIVGRQLLAGQHLSPYLEHTPLQFTKWSLSLNTGGQDVALLTLDKDAVALSI